MRLVDLLIFLCSSMCSTKICVKILRISFRINEKKDNGDPSMVYTKLFISVPTSVPIWATIQIQHVP